MLLLHKPRSHGRFSVMHWKFIGRKASRVAGLLQISTTPFRCWHKRNGLAREIARETANAMCSFENYPQKSRETIYVSTCVEALKFHSMELYVHSYDTVYLSRYSCEMVIRKRDRRTLRARSKYENLEAYAGQEKAPLRFHGFRGEGGKAFRKGAEYSWLSWILISEKQSKINENCDRHSQSIIKYS